ncbi:MAG TPA: hypothetical protein VHO46_06115 [Bacteroidales bacterium]|nr:hypothetical protein [Bacteroidales bacterium]
MKVNIILTLILLLSITGCGNNKSSNENADLNSLLAENSPEIEISEESMNAIIESIPSPVEIAMIIKQSGTGFNEGLLNPQDNYTLYTSDKSKALSIGIYSGDLGYINIFEKSFLTLNYLTTVKKLADNIGVGQFFDFETIKRLASNNDKMDSLIFISTHNFNKMDDFLRSQKRTNMSILMVTGTWIEGLYIATQNYKVAKNPSTMEWIGNQKIIIDQLLLGLSAFKNDEFIQAVATDMKTLKGIYDNITITYEYHEPESVEVDGRLVIVDKSTSKVNISEDQISQICDLMMQIRTKLIKNA